jgi:hypothetical protein
MLLVEMVALALNPEVSLRNKTKQFAHITVTNLYFRFQLASTPPGGHGRPPTAALPQCKPTTSTTTTRKYDCVFFSLYSLASSRDKYIMYDSNMETFFHFF